MSTNYRFAKPVKFKDVKSRFESLGLFVVPSEESNKDSICITDGDAYLWCYNCEDGVEFVRYGRNDVEGILNTLSDTFGAIISEHDEEYYEGENL
jgi:hypothetical protein